MSLSDKLKEFIENQDINTVKNVVKATSTEKLISFLQTNISSDNFPSLWDVLLKAVGPDDQIKKINLILNVLKEMEENEIHQRLVDTIIFSITMELKKLTPEHLIKLCLFCLNSLNKESCHFRWKELLPELLHALVEKENFVYNDQEYSGVEYKKEFINSFLMVDWPSRHIVVILSIFGDIALSKDESHKVVKKCCLYLNQLTPSEIPSVVYQCLNLSKNDELKLMIPYLQRYYEARNYSDMNQDSESPDMDLIENSVDAECRESESTVLYHFRSVGIIGKESIKHYLNHLKLLTKAPEVILQPFLLSLLLTMSTVPKYEEIIFDILKPSVKRVFIENQKRTESHFMNNLLPNNINCEALFQQIINRSLGEREHILPGLVNFALCLLSTGQTLGRDIVVEKQWHLGIIILAKIIKKKRNSASMIIGTICNRIVGGQNVNHYIEFLYGLSKKSKLLFIDNESRILQLIEALPEMSLQTATNSFDLFAVLVKVSPSIRDRLIIVFHKMLYYHNNEHRKIAVLGYISVLKSLEIENLVSLSQSSDSSSSFANGSLFTQISLSRSTQTNFNNFSNEAVCLEILNVLKKCFLQEGDVKETLYEGLYEAVCCNGKLAVPVLDFLWFHFRDFYVYDEETLPPLIMDKISIVKGGVAIMQEPLGKLISSIVGIMGKLNDNDKDNFTVNKFNKVLDSLSSRISNCELVHFELDDGTDLLDNIPDSQIKFNSLTQVLHCFESLLAYQISLSDESKYLNIKRLFEGYSRFNLFAKGLHKSKKGTRQKKVEEDSTTNIKAKHKSVHKTLISLWGFNTINKALHMLHETSTKPAPGIIQLQQNTQLHQCLLQSLLQRLHSMKNDVYINLQKKEETFKHLCDASSILYEIIENRFLQIIDFDLEVASLCLDCLENMLQIIFHNYNKNIISFFNKIGDKPSADIAVHLSNFCTVYMKLFEQCTDQDPQKLNKLSVTILTTMESLICNFPISNTALLGDVIENMNEFARTNTLPGKTCTPFMNLLFRLNLKFKPDFNTILDISSGLGVVVGLINEENKTVTNEYNIVSETTAHYVVLSICQTVTEVLNDAEITLGRLKSEFNALSFSVEEDFVMKKDTLKGRERKIVCQICLIIPILSTICNSSVVPGTLTDAIFKNVTSLYSVLTGLSKYFLTRSSKANLAFEDARFENLVKAIGKHLTPNVYKFILYIEERQKPSQDTQNTKGTDTSKLKLKVLRETKLIPKMIYEMENFNKVVRQLSKKTGVQLEKLVGLGTVRDFRIINLQEIINQESVLETQSTSNEQDESDNEDDSIEISEPASKKVKT